MKFTKMHGIGNDYIYINLFDEKVDTPEELSRRLSDRHFGVGSDGLVLIGPSETGDFSMRMFNVDGSEAQMCGNAARLHAATGWAPSIGFAGIVKRLVDAELTAKDVGG